MNHDQARQIVDDAILPMRAALSLQSWKIDIVYRRLDDGLMGTCRPNTPYTDAVIEIDCEQAEDADTLLRTLRHELLHIVHSEFQVIRKIAGQFIDGDAFDAVDVGYTMGAERTVTALESMLDNLGMSPKRLIKRGRKMRLAYPKALTH